ncbi:MAG: hypothetical protein QG670_608 [Thermoproteota archaeon]|nr:hypothetical protein [Thermoproteota archaeon]
MKVAYVSSFPPRKCGVATFTEDLIKAIDRYEVQTPGVVVAVNDVEETYNYDKRVKFQIERNSLESYLDSASWINNSDIDVVSLQHEFALYGGREGEYIISFLKKLQKPIVITLHSLPLAPKEGISERVAKKRELLKEIVALADSIVVIGSNAFQVLKEEFNARNNICVIPHGCPDIPPNNREEVKRSLGFEGKIILSTFGLINSHKGIEYVINALPSIIKQDPRVVYVLIGETHPEIRKRDGEKYRSSLTTLVDNYGLREHVAFENRFLPKEELFKYLQATDIYVVPYTAKDQVSSGTLAYAFAAGKAIISTPFPHAQELLSNGRGLFCEFENSDSIVECAITLLKDDKLRKNIEEKAYDHGRQFMWPAVAKKYIDLFKEVAVSEVRFRSYDRMRSLLPTAAL